VSKPVRAVRRYSDEDRGFVAHNRSVVAGDDLRTPPTTGAPRFVVTTRAPFARAVPGSKDHTQIPVRPAVHDAATGGFLAEIPLPPGVPSAWQHLATAPDNRTFALAGWTGPDTPLRLFLVTLDDDGRPGEPTPVPGPDEGLRAPLLDLALSRDGTRLAYAVPTRGGTRVSIVDAASAGERLTTEHHPVSVLNEQAQQGRIAPLEWQVAATGPSHAPAFTATVATRRVDGDRVVSATGTGASKAAARTAAAAALLGQLTSG
jgi:hypothetical protein